ncbi:hypothetical protein VTN02DRAFT_4160 [Thermoascus thermophilus]
MAPFDPYTQNITLHRADGTPFQVTVDEVDFFVQYGIKICINYGSQIGASIILLMVLLMLSKPEKRCSPVFFLNCSALVFNITRLICMATFFTTEFCKAYPFLSNDFSSVPLGAYVNSILGVVLTFLLLICIEISFILQTQVICSTLRNTYQRIIFWASMLMALVPIGFRCAFVVQNSILIMAAEGLASYTWLQSATNIAITISICFFSAIFVIKLGYAIRQRRKLGLRKFGPMQVIFIMGCQTMIVPASFSIMQYYIPVPEMESNVLTLVAISLPLSSMWAASALHSQSESTGDSTERRKLWNPFSSLSSDASRQWSIFKNSSSTVTHIRSVSRANLTTLGRLSPDTEAGKGIGVHRDFSVSSSHCKEALNA